MDEYVFQGSSQKMTSFRGPFRKSHPWMRYVDIKWNGPCGPVVSLELYLYNRDVDSGLS